MFVEWVMYVNRKDLLDFNSQRISWLNFVIDLRNQGRHWLLALQMTWQVVAFFKAL